MLYCLYVVNKTFLFSCFFKGVTLYNGIMLISSFNYLLSTFIIIISLVILTLTSFYPVMHNLIPSNGLSTILHIDNITKKSIEYLKSLIINKVGVHYKITEYTLLLLFIITGAIFLVFSKDLILLFLSLELQSYGLYLICTVFRDSECSTKAGLTYFLLGGLSSCIILLGLSFLYVISGNTSLENISIIHDLFSLPQQAFAEDIIYSTSIYYIYITLTILTVGLLFKISAAPFHFWSPDVYDNIPTVTTTFVAVVGKISILALLLDLTIYCSSNYINAGWINNILISSSLSLIIGTVLGLTQSRIKRLFAYSTISHIGFILLSLSINSKESIQAFIFYILQYSVSNVNGFILLITIGHFLHNYKYISKTKFENTNNILVLIPSDNTETTRKMSNATETYNLKEIDNSPIQLTTQLKGLSELNPMLALSLSITILSFLGIPPLLGFFGKQMVLSASLDAGYIFMSFIIVITSVIGGVYYLAIIKEIYFNKPEYIKIEKKSVAATASLNISDSYTIIISIITILIIIYMFVPSILLNLLNIITVSI